jgi:predicted dehydrogenase
MSRTGATAKAVAARNGAAHATTDIDAVLSDGEVDLVIITTRHDSHAELTLRALAAGKHVLVEKPLALNEDELAQIEAFYDGRDGPLLMIGFNRRFSPAMRILRSAVAGRQSPLIATYRMNAGYLPPSHWVHGPEGGGRNIGEACHIYDLFNFLTGAEVERVDAQAARSTSQYWLTNDNFVASIGYADGSVCALTYTAFGFKEYPKERMEVFADGAVASLDDYRSLVIQGPRRREWHSRTVEKGHLEELQAFADCLEAGGPWPIPLDQQLSAMRTAFAVEQRIRSADS